MFHKRKVLRVYQQQLYAKSRVNVTFYIISSHYSCASMYEYSCLLTACVLCLFITCDMPVGGSLQQTSLSV